MKESIPPPIEPEDEALNEKRLYSSEAVEAAARAADANDENESMPFFLFQTRTSFWDE